MQIGVFKTYKNVTFMYIHSIEIGFLEIPELVSLNIFSVGCIHNCDGCSNKSLQNFNHPDRWNLTDDIFAQKIVDSQSLIDSVCFLGGDPFYQCDRLKRLTDIAKNDFNLYVGAYTGYNIEDLALAGMNLDFIVDGKWNGIPVTDIKTNQRIFISNNGRWNKISYSQWINNNNRYTKNAA